MVELKRLLCPVDFSDCSKLALDYALAIARRHGSEVAVMHVLPDVLTDPDVYPYLSEPVLPSGETRERALHELGAFVHRARERELAVDVLLEDGDVVDRLVEKAAKMPADLIVIGTHGRRGFRRLLLGSVTERVVRRAGCPVLSVAPSARQPEVHEAPFRKILCPVDFSPSSMRGLELARSLARDGGELLVAHVVEFYFDASVGEAVAYDMGEVRDRHRAQAQKKLEEAIPEDGREGVRLETLVLQSGGPYKEILRLAERESADLIVMGVAGRSAADMLFFGSTTNHVVREATAPVVTVRAPE